MQTATCFPTARGPTPGATVVEYLYNAWGNLTSTTGSMASTLGIHNPLRYRGYVYDHETGLYYLQSRYYTNNADGVLITVPVKWHSNNIYSLSAY